MLGFLHEGAGIRPAGRGRQAPRPGERSLERILKDSRELAAQGIGRS
jgi:hypothetical protein